MADEEDVPPLEDMSELLKHIDVVKEKKPRKHTASNGQERLSSASKPTTKAPLASPSGHLSNQNGNPEKKKDLPQEKTQQTFGGMKKGFLFGGSSTAKPKAGKGVTSVPGSTASSSKDKDDIPLIKPKDPSAKDSQFKMPEVQQAMNASQQFLQNKDWVTDDLLGKVAKNETLTKRLADPAFMQALAEFQTNPQAAVAKYQGNQEIQKFFSEFCGILGDHFSNFGDQQGTSSPQTTLTESNIATKSADSKADISVHSSTNPNQATAEDERKMQDILNDPAVKEVLIDPDVQKLMHLLRNKPEEAQKILQIADLSLQRKIKKLVDVGLLQFQR